MEIRASYLLVGTVVLFLFAGLAAFGAWLVKADVTRSADIYEIVFEDSVTGLQQGSPVRYRGIPVGRVERIRIDPQNVERVLATIALEEETPVKQDTEAVLELQGLTGIAYVELVGGTNASPPLAADEGDGVPQIPSRPSALERVFESTPELLARGVEVVDKLTRLFDQETIDAFGRTLANVETFTGALAAQSGDIGTTLGQIDRLSAELIELTAELERLAGTVDTEVGTVGGDLVTTLEDLQGAAAALDGAATELSGMIGDIRQPLDDFAGSGLYEFTQLTGETRQLVAALTRITKEFERDPAGFFLGTGTQGFEPQ